MTSNDLYFQKMKCARPYSLVFILLATYTVLPAPAVPSTGSDVVSRETIDRNDVIHIQTSNILKRNPKYSFSAIKGAEIVKKLLRGAEQMDSKNKNIRLFKKLGTFRSAIDDFKALTPSNVQSSNSHLYQSTTVSGFLGNRLVLIERKGLSGKPTMHILREQNGVYDHADTIVYTDKMRKIGSR